MNKINLMLLICLGLSSCASANSSDKDKTKPNLLFIQTDQQAYFTMKAYGNNVIQTPALDKLANKSYVFKKAYCTQAVCSPSRSALLSGLYPHSTGVVGNNEPLNEGIKTLPEIINDPDYNTAHMGKWHLGDEIFAQRGFETWVSMEDGYSDYYSNDNDRNARSSYHHWLLEKGYEPNNKDNTFSRGFAARLPLEHCKPKFLEEKAIEYLEKVKGEPFILYVSFLEPHPPFYGPLDNFYSPEEVVLPGNFNHKFTEEHPLNWREKVAGEVAEKYDTTEQGWRELTAKYWGLVTQLDMSVGTILDKLESLGLSDNTIVVFTSDHGEMMGSHGLAHKGNHLEESARIPFLLRVPWLNKSQKMIEERVSQIDMVPTLLELMNNELPGSLHGKSLVPALKGEQSAARDIFIEKTSCITVISVEGWKLMLFKNDKSQLYNLNNDPLEMNNLYNDHEYQDVVKKLTDKIHKWVKETNHTNSFTNN